MKGYCEAWNAHDMKAPAELFVDDAHWMNTVEMHWPGKPAPSSRAMPPIIRRSSGRQASRWPTWRSGKSRRTSPPPSSCSRSILSRRRMGTARPSSEDHLTLILTKRSGRWLIAHGHNTVIDRGAQRFDPVKRGGPTRRQSRLDERDAWRGSARSRPTRACAPSNRGTRTSASGRIPSVSGLMRSVG